MPLGWGAVKLDSAITPSSPSSLRILITGGTGSFGSAFLEYLLAETPYRVRIFSRGEHRQEALAERFPPGSRVTYLLGDVRDYNRMLEVCAGADWVVHAAALKTIPAGEQQAQEFVRTNVDGTQNVVRAAVAAGVRRILFISSDKAVYPINHYGKTKAVAEGMCIQANLLAGHRDCRLAVVRGGNVWGSQGSVGVRWHAQREAGKPLSVYEPDATRFHLPMDYWLAFCWRALSEMHGGEIFVPKLKAWRVGDLAEAFAVAGVDIHGRRNGDKLNELLIPVEESGRVVDVGWAYVVQPPHDIRAVWNYEPWTGWSPPMGWRYGSDLAERMTLDELKALV